MGWYMGIKEYYGKEYADDSTRKLRSPLLYRKLKRFLLTRYDLAYQVAPGGNSLLDIGCGDGELLLRLRNKYREVWGIDIAEPRINRIQKKFGNESNIHVRVEDINEKIGFEDGSFDTITVVSVLEHVFDPYHVMKECRRLLCVGGTLIVEVPNIAWLPYRIRLLMGKVPESPECEGTEWDYAHLHSFTRTSLTNLFEKERFKVVRITCSGVFAPLRRVRVSLLDSDIFMMGIKQ